MPGMGRPQVGCFGLRHRFSPVHTCMPSVAAAASDQVDFGSTVLGQAATLHLGLVNRSPLPAHFDLSFGSPADMGATGGEGEGGGGGDPDAAFLKVARLRVSGGSRPCPGGRGGGGYGR